MLSKSINIQQLSCIELGLLFHSGFVCQQCHCSHVARVVWKINKIVEIIELEKKRGVKVVLPVASLSLIFLYTRSYDLGQNQHVEKGAKSLMHIRVQFILYSCINMCSWLFDKTI